MTFHLMSVHIISSSVWVAEWPLLGKSCSLGLPNVLSVFVILVISRFGFEGWILVLIASDPDLCILLGFNSRNHGMAQLLSYECFLCS